MRKLFNDYAMNRKPMVKVTPTVKSFKQKDENLSPATKPVASVSAFGDKIMPKNGVTAASSAKLQAAGRLPGRLGTGGAHKKLT